MTHYLAVTGADKAYLAVLIGGREFRTFELERDETEIAALMNIEEAFWQHVKDDTPPEAMAADTEAVNQQLGGADTIAETLDLTPSTELLRDYAEAEREADEADARLKELRNRICQALGEYETGAAEGYRVSWKPASRSTFDSKAFAKDHPALDLSRYYKTSTSRRFTFSAGTK